MRRAICICGMQINVQKSAPIQHRLFENTALDAQTFPNACAVIAAKQVEVDVTAIDTNAELFVVLVAWCLELLRIWRDLQSADEPVCKQTTSVTFEMFAWEGTVRLPMGIPPEMGCRGCIL